MFKKIYRVVIALFAILWIGGYVLFVIDVTETKKQLVTKVDAIIVLTGGNNRIETGLKLFSDGISNNLFISGVHPSVKREDILKMWKGDKRLPDCCITLGHIATTTLENATESREWIIENDIKSIRLVTSSYHMARALLEFRNKIKNVEIIQHIVKERRSLKDIKFWKITFSEYNKILFRSVFIALER